MRGSNETISFLDRPDSYLDMVCRRLINEKFAAQPVDFNYEGMRWANGLLGLTAADSVLDIGCSSGQFVLEAAQSTGTEAQIYGLDPYPESQVYLSRDMQTDNFTFLEGFGEDIPLPDNSVKMASAHNVLFRSRDIPSFLSEMKRVVQPEGFIIVSTNMRHHAFWRHTFERIVASKIATDLDEAIVPPRIPAEGCYFDDLPRILSQAGLQIVGQLIQRCPAVITKDRVNNYLYPIKLAANATDLSPELRGQWRKYVNVTIEPFVRKKIDQSAQKLKSKNSETEPFFADRVWRGMVVARNIKSG